MTDSPFADQADAYTVTLKFGGGYDEPWLVIRGGTATETKRRVADALGLEGHEELTLAEVIVNAKHVVQGASNVAAKLGGTAIPRSSKPKTEAQAPAAQATAPAAEDKGPDLLEEIDKLASKRAGQQFYLANRSSIDGNPETLAALTAKMKTLS